MKTCTGCGLTKDKETEFDWSPNSVTKKMYPASRCKECRKAKYRSDYATPEKQNARLLRSYGITIEQFYELLSAQDGRCAICGVEEPPTKTRWHVDHDHETGRVRGILCQYCNNGIGYFKDDPDRMVSAIEYLKKR